MLQSRKPPSSPSPDDELSQSARAAGLRYVNDALPGIRRKRAGRSFAYLDPDGNPVRDSEHLARIKSLAIPPAWTDVWICPNSRGHLQATGRDARGRKQYRYHPRWTAVRDAAKYGRLAAFGKTLPIIRERTEQDLAHLRPTREKVLAAVTRLLEVTHIRVGNEEYARQNGSIGLTTMKDRHVKIDGAALRFRFRGKSGREHTVALHDRRLARIVRQCQEIPGQELFQYLDENGQHRSIESDDVNQYLRLISGQDFTAKDFRTWAGTVLALRCLRECEPCESATHGKQQVALAIKRVAQELGNTPAVCRKCYVHPAVVEAYLADSLPPPHAAESRAGEGKFALAEEEQAVVAILREASRAAASAANTPSRQKRSA